MKCLINFLIDWSMWLINWLVLWLMYWLLNWSVVLSNICFVPSPAVRCHQCVELVTGWADHHGWQHSGDPTAHPLTTVACAFQTSSSSSWSYWWWWQQTVPQRAVVSYQVRLPLPHGRRDHRCLQGMAMNNSLFHLILLCLIPFHLIPNPRP